MAGTRRVDATREVPGRDMRRMAAGREPAGGLDALLAVLLLAATLAAFGWAGSMDLEDAAAAQAQWQEGQAQAHQLSAEREARATAEAMR